MSKDSETKKSESPFIRSIESKSKSTNSRLILALDPDYRDDTTSLTKDARSIIEATSDYICAIKMNFHLLIPLSLGEITELNNLANSLGLVTIADIKLNDIDNTNRVTLDYLWASGFSGVIVNPFVGYKDSLDVVFSQARDRGKGVITLGYMSHSGADEGFGLKLEGGATIADLFLERTTAWGADGVIIGTTRPERIAASRNLLGNNIKIISPGSG
ncbi:MAG: orotidine 5'-phosphate decarboxylase, partial [Nitrososphaerota archaeon]|nr:orotidine 5'-phosphate decarboxylase [Nitrososphaerota archaeon]